MGKRERSKAKLDLREDEEGANSSKSVICLSSSDDEEANEDLSLKIVEKAMKRASRIDHDDAVLAGRGAVIDLGSSLSEGVEVITDWGGPTTDEDVEVKSKKKKKSSKEKRASKNMEDQEKTVSILSFLLVSWSLPEPFLFRSICGMVIITLKLEGTLPLLASSLK